MPPKEDKKPAQDNKKIRCGIVMPISAIDNCNADHWAEVQNIIFDAVKSISYTPKLVSDSDEVGVIQKRIVQGLYDSEVVVCDVSGKNPNVMFELGMRLAFDKPTVIIKDDETEYSFDTGVIEHLNYPRDLRFSKIVEFKEILAKKIEATYKNSEKSDTSFLKNFGKFKIAELNEETVSADAALLDMLSDVQRDVRLLKRNNRYPNNRISFGSPKSMNFTREIQKWMEMHEIKDAIECLGNEKFYHFIERRTPAKAYFDNRHDLVEAINDNLIKISEGLA